MIRRVQKIKSFGLFEDFQWPASLLDFKQFNLIYGWNYSGKTTLSRVFRCFEQKMLHPDFAGAEAMLTAQDNNNHHLSAPQTAPMFRVFNSDFVHENLGFAAGSAEPILVLGSEDIAKQEELKAKKDEKEALALKKDGDQKKRDELSEGIEKALTNRARNIKNQFSVPEYDKTRFEPKVGSCKDSPDQFLLNSEDEAKFDALFRSTEKKPALAPKVSSLSSVEVLKEKTAALLAKLVTASSPIPRLKEDPNLENWVKEGRTLHNGKDVCQFCGQSLPAELMAHLSGHFSADYENLMAELSALAKEVQSAQEENMLLDHKADFYTELAGRFTDESAKIESGLKSRRSSLEKLATAITAKQTKAFTVLECPTVNDQDRQIADAVEKINEIIAEHNARTAEFEKKRQEAFAKLENHNASQFAIDEKYVEKLQQIADLSATIKAQDTRLAELEIEIRKLEEALSEAAKGAERINDLLAAYFGKNDLRVVVTLEKRFQIVRNGVLAKNLSEGEKTAIAFAYFIARVQDGRHPLADTRIIIDDPISSLDASHLFNTYALIKTQLAGCRQLFVLTHSFEFYNLIREWAFNDENRNKPQAEWSKWSIFLLVRIDGGNAILNEIPKVLLKFKSEYHYLFSILYEFNKAGDDDFDRVMILPNVARRFMEAFGGIMIPRFATLEKKMPRFIPNDVERERVLKFINDYSHNRNMSRSLQIPDMSECKAVVQACLKAVESWNPDYYKDLEAEVTGNA